MSSKKYRRKKQFQNLTKLILELSRDALPVG